MKRTKTLLAGVIVAVGLSSCTVMHTAVVTNNPVGSKTHTMKKGAFGKDLGVSYNEAMKRGKITKLGVAEYKVKMFLIFPTQYLTVTGE